MKRGPHCGFDHARVAVGESYKTNPGSASVDIASANRFDARNLKSPAATRERTLVAQAVALGHRFFPMMQAFGTVADAIRGEGVPPLTFTPFAGSMSLLR